MSQFNLLNYYPTILCIYINFYVIFTHFQAFLLFYPLGIVLTVYIVVCIFYIIFKWSCDLRNLVMQCIYSGVNVLTFLEKTVTLLPYLHYPLICLYKILREYILHYSLYLLVFYLKRVEFYVFCFIVIAYYY